jgi:tetratricopeptide (TPR) repeat protein
MPGVSVKARAYEGLGRLYGEQRAWEKAEEAYRTALALAPHQSYYHIRLAGVLRSQGRLEEAEMELKKAIASSNPGWQAWAYLELGALYENRGQLADAVAAFEEAVRLAPNRAYYRNRLAEAYRAAGRLAEALREYEAVLALQPDNADVRQRYEELKEQVNR